MSSAPIPVPRLPFDAFTALGVRALIRADVPVVIDLPPSAKPLDRAGIADRLGDLSVTLFTEPSERNHPQRWTTREIRLREFLEDEGYRRDPSTWHRVVSNIRNSPPDVNAILGFDAGEFFDYRGYLNAANLWVSYQGVFTKSHFDELENFNIALEGRKRLIVAPPGSHQYYPRSIRRGFGDKSQVFDFDEVDERKFPRILGKLAQRRELILEAGQMLYIPLGWWHQAESLDEVNINVNFWLRDPKILRRPYVLGAALYTEAYRKLKGIYNYQPAETAS